MRKLLIAVSLAALTAGSVGLAMAQEEGGRRGGMLFGADANNDGVVTRQEFDAGRDAMFARMDANSDGALARGEGREGRHHGRRGGGHGGMQGADANNDGNITRDEFLARPVAMFDRMDANDDGVISTAERPQRRERPEGERAERRDRPNPDTDGNGSISRAEFAAMGASMFDRLDANNDNRVTREEAQAGRSHRREGN